MRKAALDILAEEPSLFLYSMDFATRGACFYRIQENWPPQFCGYVAQFEPTIRVSLDDLINESAIIDTPLPRPVHFIWMTEYSGSTLYAKAMHETKKFYLYNETMVFAQLAILKRRIIDGQLRIELDTWRQLLKIALFFQAKSFHPAQIPLVKEWPLSDLIAPDILDCDPSCRGIFFHADLEEFLLSCLKDQRRRDIARDRVLNHFTEIGRLAPFAHLDFSQLNDAEVASLHWLTQMYLHQGASHAGQKKLRSLQNRHLFEKPEKTICASADHFGVRVHQEDARCIVEGPLFESHSKESRRKFSMKDRAEAFNAARNRYRKEVEEGLSFAETITDRYPLASPPYKTLIPS